MAASASNVFSDSSTPTRMAQLLHRHSLPDVPEDIEDDLFAHFNDPNYDLHSDSSSTIVVSDSTSAFTLADKCEDGWTSVPTTTPQGDREFQLRLDETQAKSEGSSVPAPPMEDSPYPEVRASVSNADEPLMLVNTFRVWTIGLAFSVLIPAFNTVFSFRYPSVAINALFVQVVTLPIGKLFERTMPKRTLTIHGYSLSLNSGPFNIKEHTLISVMANIVVNGAPFAEVSAAQTYFFNSPWPLARQFILGIAIQLIGFSFAGLVREFLVWPASMIWPGVLVRSALLNTMHNSYGKKDTKHISRGRFLFFACLFSFIWYWLPGFLWTGLSMFNWVCWIVPDNVVVNTLFGYQTGLGMGFLTFDWAMISYVGSPLVIPWWAQVNSFVSFVFWIWFIVPIFWAKNVFFAKFMPISSPGAFNNNGTTYDPTAVLTDGVFDQQKYEQYSPIFLTITFLITYGTCCASYTAVVVHTLLWYRRDIARQFRKSLVEQTDVHSRLMRVYSEVPRWWYIGLGAGSFVLACVGIEICNTELPVWGLVIALLLSMLFVIPLGIVQAISNQQFTLHVLAEVIAGFALPGKPLAGMVFKAFASNTTSQALVFVGDLKIGHYMKIPPRMMWISQVIASIVAVFTSFLVQTWAFNNIEDICTPGQKDFFTCPGMIKFGTSSLVWSGIGPKRLFAIGALYAPMAFFFLIGAILPIPFWFLATRYPRSNWRYVHIPVQLMALSIVPPATGINYSSWILIGFIFQWFMRRFHFRWWMRYVYILSSGLDAGIIFGLVVIFFALQVSKHSVSLDWWGNTVWKETADAKGTPFFKVTPGHPFGPKTWS